MIHFDEVYQAFSNAAETLDVFRSLREVTIIRDVEGRVNLFLDPGDNRLTEEITKLWQEILGRNLNGYWGDEIWVKSGTPSEADKSLFELIEGTRRAWPHDFPSLPAGPNYYYIERYYLKSGWSPFAVLQMPPWPIERETPGIAVFHAFKGGVGRTTVLAVLASVFARSGYRVAAVDFDLESPGLGSLLLGENLPDWGLVDYLVEQSVLQEGPDLNDYVGRVHDAEIIGEGPRIVVMPAGRVDLKYIEKLARIDYASLTESGFNPMNAFLARLREAFDPELIFLDARAGLNDLAAMLLTGPCHLDLLCGTDSPQSWHGLETLVSALGRSDPPPMVKTVQTMYPSGPPGAKSKERFAEQSYRVFEEHYYNPEEVPDIGVADAMHSPFHIPDIGRLREMSYLPISGEHFELLRGDGGFRDLLTYVSEILQKPLGHRVIMG
jgi:hypothetical protein